MQPATFDAKIWFAIAEPSRRSLVDILLIKGGASASKLAGEVPFSRQAVAKHMAVLKRAGLVRTKRVGKEVQFLVEPKGIAVAARELSAAALQWDARLTKIKQIAEAMP